MRLWSISKFHYWYIKGTTSLLITDFYTRKFLMSNQWRKLYTIPHIQLTKQLDFEWWIFRMNGMKIIVAFVCTTRQNWMSIPIMTAVMSKKYSIISCVGPSYCCANFIFFCFLIVVRKFQKSNRFWCHCEGVDWNNSFTTGTSAMFKYFKNRRWLNWN